MLGDEEDLPRLGQRGVHHHERTRRRERKREDVLERALELRLFASSSKATWNSR